jgi:hypothetical protein
MVINNVAYSWAMVTLTAPALTGDNSEGSTLLNGVTAISWERKRNIQNNYGMGGEPVNRGFGNMTYTASITMDYNTQVALRALKGSLTQLGEFDLTISFANEMGTEDWTTETITLKGCIFSEDGMDVKQDDTTITKEFNLNPFKIILSTDAA